MDRYAYLPIAASAAILLLFGLLLPGLALLIGYNILARAYWFSVPRRGIALATVLYAAAIAMDWC